jgi:hypothetical protein
MCAGNIVTPTPIKPERNRKPVGTATISSVPSPAEARGHRGGGAESGTPPGIAIDRGNILETAKG